MITAYNYPPETVNAVRILIREIDDWEKCMKVMGTYIDYDKGIVSEDVARDAELQLSVYDRARMIQILKLLNGTAR